VILNTTTIGTKVWVHSWAQAYQVEIIAAAADNFAAINGKVLQLWKWEDAFRTRAEVYQYLSILVMKASTEALEQAQQHMKEASEPE
jgi:hypothetical protein